MLEGKRNDILRSLKRSGDKAMRKPFRDDHLDPSHGLASIPPTLREGFLVEKRKSQGIGIPSCASIWNQN